MHLHPTATTQLVPQLLQPPTPACACHALCQLPTWLLLLSLPPTCLPACLLAEVLLYRTSHLAELLVSTFFELLRAQPQAEGQLPELEVSAGCLCCQPRGAWELHALACIPCGRKPCTFCKVQRSMLVVFRPLLPCVMVHLNVARCHVTASGMLCEWGVAVSRRESGVRRCAACLKSWSNSCRGVAC